VAVAWLSSCGCGSGSGSGCVDGSVQPWNPEAYPSAFGCDTLVTSKRGRCLEFPSPFGRGDTPEEAWVAVAVAVDRLAVDGSGCGCLDRLAVALDWLWLWLWLGFLVVAVAVAVAVGV
jgi:hypothetical protein